MYSQVSLNVGEEKLWHASLICGLHRIIWLTEGQHTKEESMHHSIYRSFLLVHKCFYHPWRLHGIQWFTIAQDSSAIKKRQSHFRAQTVASPQKIHSTTSRLAARTRKANFRVRLWLRETSRKIRLMNMTAQKSNVMSERQDMTCGALLQPVFTDIMSFLGMSCTCLEILSFPISFEYVHVTRHTPNIDVGANCIDDHCHDDKTGA